MSVDQVWSEKSINIKQLIKFLILIIYDNINVNKNNSNSIDYWYEYFRISRTMTDGSIK